MGTWAEATSKTEAAKTGAEPKSPDASARVKDALLRVRRAELTRIVKGVVGVSALVCLLALGRAAMGSSEESLAAGAPSQAMRAPEDAVVARVLPHVDVLSARTTGSETVATKIAPARSSGRRHLKRR